MGDRSVGVTDTASGAGVADIRVRERSIGGTTYGEQYVVPINERVPRTRISVATFRTTARAVATQAIWVLQNPATNPNSTLFALRELILSVETIAAKTVINPYARLHRFTGAPTGGTSAVLNNNLIALADPATNSVMNMDSSADGTLSGTALSFTPTTTLPLASRFIGRMHTLAGTSPAGGTDGLDMLKAVPDDHPIELDLGESIGLRIEAAAALVAADFQYVVDSTWEEFTRP